MKPTKPTGRLEAGQAMLTEPVRHAGSKNLYTKESQ